jgi:uncharacterized membrane protein
VFLEFFREICQISVGFVCCSVIFFFQKDLYDKSTDKGNKLRQAADQQTLNRALADAQVSTRVISLVILINLVAIIFVLQLMTSDFPFGIFKLFLF